MPKDVTFRPLPRPSFVDDVPEPPGEVGFTPLASEPLDDGLMPDVFTSSAPQGPGQPMPGRRPFVTPPSEATQTRQPRPFSEPAFRRWYADRAARLGLDPNPDGQLYDYRAAFAAGAEPGPDGHWPSEFKLDEHPNRVVGGFDTRTGERVPGTPRASEQELVDLGWEPEAARRLAVSPEPRGRMAALVDGARDLGNAVGGAIEAVGEFGASLPQRFGTDPALALGKGIIGLGEAAVGLADLGLAAHQAGKPGRKLSLGKALEDATGWNPTVAKAFLDEFMSRAATEGQDAIDDAEGVLETTVAALSHPQVMFTSAVESLPSMLGGGAAGRAVRLAGASAGMAGAVGEGLISAGATAEGIRQQSDDRVLSPRQAVIAAGSGGAVATFGKLGAATAKRLGVIDFETAMAAAAADERALRGFVSQVLLGAVEEGLVEELPQSIIEQAAQNLATGQPIAKGVDKAAVMGALVGGMMGGGTQIGSRVLDRLGRTARTGEGAATDEVGNGPQAAGGAGPAVLGQDTPPPAGPVPTIGTDPTPPPVPPPSPTLPPDAVASLQALGYDDQTIAGLTLVEAQDILRSGPPAPQATGMASLMDATTDPAVRGEVVRSVDNDPALRAKRDEMMAAQRQEPTDEPMAEPPLDEEPPADPPMDAGPREPLPPTPPPGSPAGTAPNPDIAYPQLLDETKDWRDVASWLAAEAADRGLSVEEVARRAGLPSTEEGFKQWIGDMPDTPRQAAARKSARTGKSRITPGMAALAGAETAPKPEANDDFDAEVAAILAELQAESGGTTPTVEVVDPESTPTTENASGESAASAEAQSRQEGMKARGERFVVYDRAGRPRDLIGPDAVDYEPKLGETYGIAGPDGFRVLRGAWERTPAWLLKASKDDGETIPAAAAPSTADNGGKAPSREVYRPTEETTAPGRSIDLATTPPAAAEPVSSPVEDEEAWLPTRANIKRHKAPPVTVDAFSKRGLLVHPSVSEGEDGEWVISHQGSKLTAVVGFESEAAATKMADAILRQFPAVDWSIQDGDALLKSISKADRQALDKLARSQRESAERRRKQAQPEDTDDAEPEPTREPEGTADATGTPATITRNTDKGSVEVKFPGKPAADVLANLKKHGFRWAKTSKTWYSKHPNAWERAHGITGQTLPSNGENQRTVEEPKPAPDPFKAKPALYKVGDRVSYEGEMHEVTMVNSANPDRLRIAASSGGSFDAWANDVKPWKAAEGTPKPAAPRKKGVFADVVNTDQKAIGTNADGETVYEAANGARSVVADGIRIKEKVRLVPGRGGIETSLERDADGEPTDARFRVKPEPLATEGAREIPPDDEQLSTYHLDDEAQRIAQAIREGAAGGRIPSAAATEMLDALEAVTQRITSTRMPVDETREIALALTEVSVRLTAKLKEQAATKTVESQGFKVEGFINTAPKPDARAAKLAELKAKAAKAQAEIDAALADVKTALKKSGSTLNSGLPVDAELVGATLRLVRAYLGAGIVEAENAWLLFQDRMGQDAARAKRAFEIAWRRATGDAVTLSEVSDDAGANGGRADGDERDITRRDAADAPRASDESSLDPVAAEDDRTPESGAGRGRRGQADADAGAPGRVPGVGDEGAGGRVDDDRGDPGSLSARPVPATGDSVHGPGVAPSDYHYTPERIAAIVNRGAMERLRGNIAAIRVVQALQAEKRHATAEEQDILAKYVGWGDIELASFLSETPRYDWRPTQREIYDELRTLTTEDDRKALIRSSTNAHFTYGLYRPLWAALERAGFTGGRVLEPAIGTGHAFGMMSPEVRQASRLNGVELEPFTATIAGALFPSARIQALGYERAAIAAGTQDLIISNVPFGKFGVKDPRVPEEFQKPIHNYFFAKALTHVRPGGLIAFVTTHHTMDAAAHTGLRRHLMQSAHFVGAVRLPKEAFGATAKTEVITDLVILQKFAPGETVARNADAFINSDEIEIDGLSGRRSRWYSERPELVLGTENMEGSMYGGRRKAKDDGKAPAGEYSVAVRSGEFDGLYAKGLAAILPPGTYTAVAEQREQEDAAAPQQAEAGARPGDFRLDGDRVLQVGMDGRLTPVEPTRNEKQADGTTKAVPDTAKLNRLRGMIGVRDALRSVVATMQDRDATDAQIAKAQKTLKKTYDAFERTYGLLNSRVNRPLFQSDPEAANLRALEIIEPKVTFDRRPDGTERTMVSLMLKGLSDIFTKRTLHPKRVITSAANAKDALLISLGMRTVIDWSYMAKLTGWSKQALQADLAAQGLVYEQPNGTWVTSDEYLSGDVVTKLADAKAAVEDGQARFAENVKALEAIQPKPKEIGQIRASFGAHWVPSEVYQGFFADLLGVSFDRAPTLSKLSLQTVAQWRLDTSIDESASVVAQHPLTVKYGPEGNITSEEVDQRKQEAEARGEEWEATLGSGETFTVLDAIDAALNLKNPSLTYTIRTREGTSTFKHQRASDAARAAIAQVKERWEAWLLEHPDAHQGAVDVYNERYNRTVERVFDGAHLADHLRDSGYASWDLHPHQLNAIWRALVSGNTLLAHEVGAGKTLEMIVIAMEMRRTGRANKPMITVPTYLIPQWSKDITAAYPAAKVLAFSEDDLKADRRQEAMSRIAFGDWDIVLVPHSSFELLRVAPETMQAQLDEWLNEVLDAEARERAANGDDDPNVKALEKRRRALEDKIQKLGDRAEKGDDANLVWEQLGVDALLVDEAHAFKNLYFHTGMDTIRGVSQSNSDRSLDMFIKIKAVNEQSGFRNVVFATATPVMNSLVEVYAMQRYLQSHRLREYGFESFDDWYRTFADARPSVEIQPDGAHKEVMRAAKFRNLDLLSRVLRETMDYVGWKEMPYLKLPKVAGGKVEIVETDPHPVYAQLKQWFAERLRVLERRSPHVSRKLEGAFLGPIRRNPLTGESMQVFDGVINVMNDAANAAIDPRLVLGNAVKDVKGSRIQRAAEDIYQQWKTTKKNRAVSLVFLDKGTPKTTEIMEFLKDSPLDDATAEVEALPEDDATPVLGEDGEASTFVEQEDQTNLYDALRDLLIAKGVPKREIAYVHQARNATERLALFEAAKTGRVRIVIGSTDKGGVGMSIQDNLAAMFEIDPPRYGRPGDLRQRLGRIIRQGNRNLFVRLVRYVTKNSTDEWTYGMVMAKSDMVEQVMRGEATEAEEEDPSTMSIEEAQMRASGNPKAKRLATLRGLVKTLGPTVSGLIGRQQRAAASIQRLERSIAYDEERLGKLRAWKGGAPDLSGDNFAITIGDTTYTKRPAANDALLAAMKRVVDKSRAEGKALKEVVGSFGGLDLVVSLPYRGADADLAFDTTPVGWTVDPAITTVKHTQDFGAGRNVIASLSDRYRSYTSLDPDRLAELWIGKDKENLAAARKIAAEEIPQVQQLKEVRAELAEIEAELVKGEGEGGAVKVAPERLSDLLQWQDARMEPFALAEKARRDAEKKRKKDAKEKQAERRLAKKQKAVGGAARAAVGSFAPSAPAPTLQMGTPGGPLTTRRASNDGLFPELVAFVEELTGKPPAVVERFRNRMTKAMFRGGFVLLKADMFKRANRAQLAAALAHEIGHLVDWLPDFDDRRGNLLGHLRSLHRFMKHTYTSQDGSKVSNAEVKKELLALSKSWRPFPADYTSSYEKYRHSPHELYADAISVLLNEPKRVETEAPIFFKEFHAELDRKPEVKAAYLALIDAMSMTAEELSDRRIARARGAYQEGDQKTLDVAIMKHEERKLRRSNLAMRLQIDYVDKNAAVNKMVEDARARGQYVPIDKDPRYLLQEREHIGALGKVWVEEHVQPIQNALEDAGITWETFGLALMYERIIGGDRSEMANPGGISADEARTDFSRITNAMTPSQRTVLNEQLQAFRAAVKLQAENGYDAGLYTDEQIRTVRGNDFYATFQTVDHIADGVSSGMMRAIGTTKGIRNAADATILKTLVTIRAAEHNRVKRDAFAWMLKNAPPGSVVPAKQQWDANSRTMKPSDPPRGSNLTLVEWKEKGRWRGAWTDPYVAAAFERHTVGYLNGILQALQTMNGWVFRPLFTVYNPGFMLFNAGRDFLRFWKATPNMTLRRAAKRYLDAVPMAKARAKVFGYRGDPSKFTAEQQAAVVSVREAEKARILDVTLSELMGIDDLEPTAIEQIMAEAGVQTYANERGRVRKTLDWLRDVGDFIETLPKAAAIIELTSDGRTIAELEADERSFIRRKVGSPDFKQGGRARAWMNNVFLYSNAIVQGTRADYETATEPTTAWGWWVKTVVVNVLPKMVTFGLMAMAAGAAGDDDDEDGYLRWLGDLYAGIPEYDLTNYLIVPLGRDSKGKTRYLRMPQDDTGRLIGGLTWKVMGFARGDRDFQAALAQIVHYTAGQGPGLTPTIAVLGDGADFASGKNVYDDFRSRPIFSREEMDLKPSDRLPKFLAYEWNQAGGSVFWRLNEYDGPERPKSVTERVLNAPIISNTAGRFFKVSDQGRRERLAAARQPAREKAARSNRDERRAVAEVTDAIRRLPPPEQRAAITREAQRIARELHAGEARASMQAQERDIKKKLTVSVRMGATDLYVDALLTGTNAEKAAVLKEARRAMAPATYAKWLAVVKSEGILSDAMTKTAEGLR